MTFLKEHKLFVFLLLLCAALRLWPLFGYQFTYDELSGLERTQFTTFEDLIQKGVKIDAHPALIQLVIYYLVANFGYVTWVVKLPFILASLGTVIYAYLLGWRIFSRNVGLVAATVTAFSLVFVYYAPIARMYGPGMFFSMAMLYYFSMIFLAFDLRFRHWFWFGFFAWLCALNHHMNALFAFSLFVSGFFFMRKDNYRQFLFTAICVIAAYLPHLPITIYQLNVGGIGRAQGGWLDTPRGNEFIAFIKILSGTSKCWMVFAILVPVVIIFNKKFSISRAQVLLSSLFIFNYLVVYLYSILKAPVYQHSVMLFASVTLVILVATFLDARNKYVAYGVVTATACSLLYSTYILKNVYKQTVKTVFEYQFERTDHYKKKYGDENVFPFFFDADDIMKKIYFKKYNTQFECMTTADPMMAVPNRAFDRPAGPVSSLRMFSEFVDSLQCEYVILTSSLPLHQAIVKESFPYLIENMQTQAVNLKVYSRKASDVALQVQDEERKLYVVPGPDQTFSTNGAGEFPFNVKEGIEFPFEMHARYEKLVTAEGMVMLVKTGVKGADPDLENCISIKDTRTGENLGYSAKSKSDFLSRNDYLYSDFFFGTGHEQRKDALVSVYLWNKKAAALHITGAEIEVIDYWHEKWHYWD